MDVERRLRRVEPRKRTGLGYRYFFIKTFYLEDLIAIYNAIDSTLDEAKADRESALSSLERLRTLEVRSGKLDQAELASGDLGGYYHKPLISMDNKEHEFDTLDDVAGIQRTHFEEFSFLSTSPTISVHLSKFICLATAYDDNEAVTAAMHTIDHVIRRRQSLLARPIERIVSANWYLPVTGVVCLLAMFNLVLPSPQPIVAATGIAAFVSALLTILIVLFGILLPALRQRVVVPRFRSEAETFWDKRGNALIGAAATILVGIATVLLAK